MEDIVYGGKVLSITAELYEFIVKVVEDKVKDIMVTREEFDKLARVVRELGEKISQLVEAQLKTEGRLEQLAKRVDQLTERLNQLIESQRLTEERLNRLAEAQTRTEERLNQLAKRVDQLAEAQRRTEERLNELVKRVDQLAEAQRGTEERLNQLAIRVDQLAEAQLRTEERLNKLVEAIDLLRREVGRLSETIGFGLEDIARVVLPGWLYRHLGVEVDELVRRFIVVDGVEIEVNLYGEGRRDREKVVVIGECKSRIYSRDVDQFYTRVFRPVSRLFERETRVIGVLFGYWIHPSAQKRAEELGLYVVASYQR